MNQSDRKVTSLSTTKIGPLQSEDLLGMIIAQSPIAVGFLRGREMILETCNDALLKIWDMDASIIGLPLTEALPDIHNHDYPGILKRVYETGEPFTRKGYKSKLSHLQHPDTEIYLDFTYTPLRGADDEIAGLMLFATDVTQEYKARRQLQETEGSLREAIELAELATWRIDPPTGAIWYSDRMKEWIGVRQDERDFDEGMNPVPESDRERVRQALEYAMTPESGGIYDLEHPVQNAITGQIRIIHARARVFFDESGKPIRMTGTAYDVTMHRNAQLALEQQVKERTEELDASNEELQATNEELQVTNEELANLNDNLLQSNEALQQFAHVASHDLKEPLRKIKTFLGRIEADEKTIISESSKPFLARVYTAADRMAAMISGVLTYSSLNSSQEPIQPIDLEETMNHIVVDLEVLISQKKATVKYERLPKLEGASVLIYQLFYNLVMNALKFSRQDVTPLIEIKFQATHLHRRPFARLIITDNGIGFDPSQAERIFNTFTRLNSKDKFEGTGLGLSLCRKIVNRHGGTITATGKIDKGAEFTIMLPLNQAHRSV